MQPTVISSPWTTIRVDHETHKQLADKANSEGTSIGNVLRKILNLPPVTKRAGRPIRVYKLVKEGKK